MDNRTGILTFCSSGSSAEWRFAKSTGYYPTPPHPPQQVYCNQYIHLSNQFCFNCLQTTGIVDQAVVEVLAVIPVMTREEEAEKIKSKKLFNKVGQLNRPRWHSKHDQMKKGSAW